MPYWPLSALYRGARVNYLARRPKGTASAFFAFLEAVETLPRRDAPRGRAGASGTRRYSCIEVSRFVELSRQFEHLDHRSVTDAQRQRRRDNLLEHLEDVSFPVFEVELPGSSRQRKRRFGGPRSWSVLAIAEGPAADDEIAVIWSDLERPEQDRLPGVLVAIAAVAPYWLSRLQDIFSLVHVPDADWLEEGGNEPTRAGPPDAAAPLAVSHPRPPRAGPPEEEPPMLEVS